MLIFWILPLIFSFSAFSAGPDICEILDIKNCPGVSKQARRSSAQSLPTIGTAAQFNPANVSHDRGVGVETIYQPSQSPTFNFVSGTGKTGAALVSSKLENAFFANRVIELDQDYWERREAKDQYESDKYNLALGLALWKNRKASLDLGFLFKYNADSKRLNPGAGISARAGFLTLGAAVYKDDVVLKFKDKMDPFSGTPYSVIWGKDQYHETFIVQNLYAGIKIRNLFLDAGVIKTHYKFYDQDSTITIYSASYIYENFLLNLAMRREASGAPKYKDGQLVQELEEQSMYGGLQYSINQNFITGLHYNYYLLDEVSVSLTLFI